MKGKVCIVTGATDGIGRVAAQALAAQGARVVIVGRNEEKTARVCEELCHVVPGAKVEFDVADLSSQRELRELGTRLLARCERIDVLLNNAGAFFHRRAETVDGLERTLALNHLGYFLLTGVLLERLRESGASRIVNVSSRAHTQGEISFDDINLERNYTGWRAYRASKLANVLFTRALARRLKGTEVTTNCLHPGLVATRFAMDNGLVVRAVTKVLMTVAGISPEEGARTSIFLASDPSVAGISGQYFDRCAPADPAPAALDDAAGERLWEMSERLVNLPASALVPPGFGAPVAGPETRGEKHEH